MTKDGITRADRNTVQSGVREELARGLHHG